MTVRSREDQLVNTFVAMADSLVADYDVVDLLQKLVDDCITLFDASAAGILLVASGGELEVVVSTNERSEFLGLMQAKTGEGPCVEAVETRKTTSLDDLRRPDQRWPAFSAAARDAGFAAVHAIPMRLRDSTIGSLNLFRDQAGELNGRDAVAAQALADVATISILQERAHRQSDVAREQLQRALDSRIVIEQAKGVLAHTKNLDMDQAFTLIREHARSHQTRLRDTAKAIVEGELVL
jgi:transcriptional regulator with GAF, ATPase, and Fis domain